MENWDPLSGTQLQQILRISEGLIFTARSCNTVEWHCRNARLQDKDTPAAVVPQMSRAQSEGTRILCSYLYSHPWILN